MKKLTDRDKAENLWQILNAVLIIIRLNRHDKDWALEIEDTLSINRPNSEETQIDQDKIFAKKVLNELPLSSDIPLVNRLIVMCKDELGIED